MIVGVAVVSRIGQARAEAPLPVPAARVVRSLSFAVFLQWAGAGAILPLLPLYVRDRGGSDAVVGAVMAGFFVAAFFFQYGAGRMSDRLGRLPVMLGGLVVEGVGSLLFLLPGPPALDVVFRALQGAGAGGSGVAALAMVSHAVPMSHRGRAVGRVYAAQIGGLAIGPVLGSLAGLGAMRVLFVVAAAASTGAVVPVLWGQRRATQQGEDEDAVPAVPRDRPIYPRALTGALVAAALIGVTVGIYEACWTLLLTHRGATQWEVGVSWTLFALPFALMSRPGGWLADHLDRRWLAAGTLAWSLAFCAMYPFIPNVPLLLALGVGEALGAAMTLPACQSLLGEGTAPGDHGKAQGEFAASQTVTTAISAACAGALFAVAPWVPFVSAAALGALGLVALAVIWRRGVPGRVTSAARGIGATTPEPPPLG